MALCARSLTGAGGIAISTMSQFYLRVALMSLLSLIILMLLIHAQPYDDHNLSEFMTPKSCSMPCFMGIVPRVTTLDEAVRLLKSSGWVSKVNSQVDDTTGKMLGITVRWNANAPLLLQKSAYSGYLTVNHNRIDQIFIGTSVNLGDFWLSMGVPSDYGLISLPGQTINAEGMQYGNVYAADYFAVIGVAHCHYFANLWNNPVTIYFFSKENPNIKVPGGDYPIQFFQTRVSDRDDAFCAG